LCCSIEEQTGLSLFSRRGCKEVDLKALGNFAFNDQVGTIADVPVRFRALDGQRVILRGFMYGTEDLASGGRRFQLVYDTSTTRRRGPPLVQERVFATAGKDVPIFDMSTFAEVAGTLHVKVVRDPSSGRIVSVYCMEVDWAERLDEEPRTTARVR
jgi:hypothetical protein